MLCSFHVYELYLAGSRGFSFCHVLVLHLGIYFCTFLSQGFTTFVVPQTRFTYSWYRRCPYSPARTSHTSTVNTASWASALPLDTKIWQHGSHELENWAWLMPVQRWICRVPEMPAVCSYFSSKYKIELWKPSSNYFTEDHHKCVFIFCVNPWFFGVWDDQLGKRRGCRWGSSHHFQTPDHMQFEQASGCSIGKGGSPSFLARCLK